MKGVPTLIMLNAQTGECLAENAVDDVTKNGPMQIEKYIKQCS